MTETPTTETRSHGGKDFLPAIMLIARGMLLLACLVTSFLAIQFQRERNTVLAENADLQKQLADLKAKPRFHADAVRFFAISQPSKRTIVVSDATVILSDSDVPQLTRKILDWLTQHPDEVGKRGLSQLRAEIF